MRTIVPDEVPGLLDGARSVVIVPGYGMAVAHAQHGVAELAKILVKRGIAAKYVIHSVAGHMNALLAEVNVPYDQLCEMEQMAGRPPETPSEPSSCSRNSGRIFEAIKAINRTGVTVLVVEQNAHRALLFRFQGYRMIPRISSFQCAPGPSSPLHGPQAVPAPGPWRPTPSSQCHRHHLAREGYESDEPDRTKDDSFNLIGRGINIYRELPEPLHEINHDAVDPLPVTRRASRAQMFPLAS